MVKFSFFGLVRGTMKTPSTPGAQTERRGEAGPVRVLLRGWDSPAALLNYSVFVGRFCKPYHLPGRFCKPSYFGIAYLSILAGAAGAAARCHNSVTSCHSFCQSGRSAAGRRPNASAP